MEGVILFTMRVFEYRSRRRTRRLIIHPNIRIFTVRRIWNNTMFLLLYVRPSKNNKRQIFKFPSDEMRSYITVPKRSSNKTQRNFVGKRILPTRYAFRVAAVKTTIRLTEINKFPFENALFSKTYCPLTTVGVRTTLITNIRSTNNGPTLICYKSREGCFDAANLIHFY